MPPLPLRLDTTFPAFNGRGANRAIHLLPIVNIRRRRCRRDPCYPFSSHRKITPVPTLLLLFHPSGISPRITVTSGDGGGGGGGRRPGCRLRLRGRGETARRATVITATSGLTIHYS